VKRPIRLEKMRAWLRRPGRASVFTAIAGIAHEWITSEEVIKKRIVVFEGSCKSSEVFIRRRELDLSIKFSVSFIFSLVYS